MLEGLREVPDANSCLPFVRQFYAQPSTYVWHDTNGQPHAITQAEGGEQGRSIDAGLYFPLDKKEPWKLSKPTSKKAKALYGLP